jgi:hypothetical protein
MFLDYCNDHNEAFPMGGKCPICSGLITQSDMEKPWQPKLPTRLECQSDDPGRFYLSRFNALRVGDRIRFTLFFSRLPEP